MYSDIRIVTIPCHGHIVSAYAVLVCVKVQLTVPFSRTSFSTTASFEVRSPKRLQVSSKLTRPTLCPNLISSGEYCILGQSDCNTQRVQDIGRE